MEEDVRVNNLEKGNIIGLLCLLSMGTILGSYIGIIWYNTNQETIQRKSAGFLLFMYGSTPPKFEVKGEWLSYGGGIVYKVDDGPQITEYFSSWSTGSVFLRGYRVQACVFVSSHTMNHAHGWIYCNGKLLDEEIAAPVVFDEEYPDTQLMQLISIIGLLLLI